MLFSFGSCTKLLYFKDFMPWIVELDAPVSLFMNELQLNGAERRLSDVFLKLNFKRVCACNCVWWRTCVLENMGQCKSCVILPSLVFVMMYEHEACTIFVKKTVAWFLQLCESLFDESHTAGDSLTIRTMFYRL